MRYALGLGILASLVLLPTAAACVSIDPKSGIAPGDELDVTDHICTLAFLLVDENGLYFSTAGHCIHVNETASNPVIGKFGTGAYHYLTPETGAETDGSPGEDFALIRIDPSFYSKINPSVCGWGGPKGIYTASPAAGGVKHFGHGTVVGDIGPTTQQRQGFNLQTDAKAFYWTGAGVPGDSGSAVLSDDLKAVGVLTHLIVSPPDDNGGTRLARGFSLAATAGFPNLRLVLEGEDPVAILTQMQANATRAPTKLTPTTTPNASGATNSSSPSNQSAPAQSGSPASSPTPPPSSGQALQPGAVREADGAKKTPGPTLPLALLAVGLVLIARRFKR